VLNQNTQQALALPEKEVIQPHLPVWLPCYDFTLVTSPTFSIPLLVVKVTTSGMASSHSVMGGVYLLQHFYHYFHHHYPHCQPAAAIPLFSLVHLYSCYRIHNYVVPPSHPMPLWPKYHFLPLSSPPLLLSSTLSTLSYVSRLIES
jgi:hypothetical protein